MTPSSQPSDPQLPEFGDAGDLEELMQLAEITDADIDAAVAWWNDNASPAWVGALDE